MGVQHSREVTWDEYLRVSCPTWVGSTEFGTCRVFVSQAQCPGWVRRLKERPVVPWELVDGKPALSGKENGRGLF